jgi:hypothetical protein
MEGVYEIPNGNLLEGSIPANKEKLVKAWIEIHREELMANWELAVTGNKVFTIDPLNENMNPKVLTAQYKGNHKLLLTFTNNEVKQFDLKAYLKYPVYESLKDETFCKKLRVTDGIVQWNDYIDFDPDTLYLESKTINEACPES